MSGGSNGHRRAWLQTHAIPALYPSIRLVPTRRPAGNWEVRLSWGGAAAFCLVCHCYLASYIILRYACARKHQRAWRMAQDDQLRNCGSRTSPILLIRQFVWLPARLTGASSALVAHTGTSHHTCTMALAAVAVAVAVAVTAGEGRTIVSARGVGRPAPDNCGSRRVITTARCG